MQAPAVKFKHVEAIALSVTDLARANQFYAEVLGLPPAYQGGEQVGYWVGPQILMLKPDWYAPPTDQPNPRVTIQTDDAHQTEQQLRERGVVIPDPVQDFGPGDVGSFLDSEGNKLWFCSPHPEPKL